jgi:hypothetical protein
MGIKLEVIGAAVKFFNMETKSWEFMVGRTYKDIYEMIDLNKDYHRYSLDRGFITNHNTFVNGYDALEIMREAYPKWRDFQDKEELTPYTLNKFFDFRKVDT